jgi:hypothetical protein
VIAQLADIQNTTSLINFLFLAISLWLGIYLVTRSPRSPIAWLGGITLWAMSGYYLNNIFFVNVLHGQSVMVALRLSRWAIIPVPVLWLHLSTLYLPAHLRRRWRRPLYVVYPVAAALLILGSATNYLMRGVSERPSVYLSRVTPGPLYGLFFVYLVSVAALSLHHFYLAQREAPTGLSRRQIVLLFVATLLSSVSGIYLSIGTWMYRDWLTVIGDAGLGLGVLVLGYAVMRYQALIEGRTLRLDFAYALTTVSIVTVAYVAGTILSYSLYHIPFIAFIFVLILAIVTHSIIDWGRTFFDRFFYRRQIRILRANLRAFTQDVGTKPTLADRLHLLLEAVRDVANANASLVALREDPSSAQFEVLAASDPNLVGMILDAEILLTSESADLPISQPLPPPLQGMVLAVPLDDGLAQIGVLLLGPKRDRQPYTELDIDLLDQLADRIVTTVVEMKQQELRMEQIDKLVADFQKRETVLRHSFEQLLVQQARLRATHSDLPSTKQLARWVEDGLRHLYDYSYLGDHEMARLQVVQRRLTKQSSQSRTHLDKGRAVKDLLLAALDKLRPEGKMPVPPTKDWHSYIILHDAYVRDQLTRDIMSRLYISEATFHRTRRRAIRSVAKALLEMEQETQRVTASMPAWTSHQPKGFPTVN